ncbi:hypothetical protein [Candidatus Puniceispirillum sp.]
MKKEGRGAVKHETSAVSGRLATELILSGRVFIAEDAYNWGVG